jgi:long-chain acyl-CoA synthetase
MTGWRHPADIPFVRRAGDPCIVDARRAFDSGEFAAGVQQVAVQLQALGVGPGSVVATMVPNRLELVLVLFAAWHLGAAVTPVNPALTNAEAGYQLEDAGAVTVLVDDASAVTLAGAAAKHLHVNDVMRPTSQPVEVLPRRSLGDTAFIIYTSGTTGRPKGVVLEHRHVAAMVGMLTRAWTITAADRALLFLPLFHVNALLASLLTPLAAGGSTVVLEGFDRKTFWNTVERHRPTYFSAVPTIYLLLLDQAEPRPPDASSLRFCVCGAAPMPPEAIGRFEARFGVTVVEGYGLSETTVACTLNPLDGPRKAGSVGPALDGLDVRIFGEGDVELSRGDVGEVVVRGPTVMTGYLNRPEETAATLRGDWLHTGDLGYLDPDGYLYLVDRKKDMIIRGGENIYPKEIENVLHRHPAVLEAAVVGRPDPLMGEEPVAFVTLHGDASATPNELIAHAAGHIAPFKVPRAVHILEALPRNSVGKVTKGELRTRLTAG